MAEQIAPGTSAYNLPEAWRLKGPLDLEALQQGLDSLSERHESLRTVFGVRDGRPVQLIFQRRPFPVELLDFQGVENQPSELHERLAAEARRPFDLTRGPLARCHLFRLSEDEHVLLINLHHLIGDEWSFGVLLRELGLLYDCARKGQRAALPKLPIQYADFAVWQREREAGPLLDADLEFWKRALRPPIPLLLLPSDKPRPLVRTLQGKARFFSLDKALTEGLQELSRSQGATLFMTLLAGFQTLLHRYSRQTDIIVGSPIAGRNSIETEGLIGLFANTPALRTDFSGDPPCCDLLARVRETVLDAYAHQEVSMARILEMLQPERGAARHPLFQTIFGLQTGATDQWALPGLTLEHLELDNGGSKFELSILLTETREGLRGRCEYSDEIFEEETISGLLRQYEVLLKGMLAAPERHISELPLLEASEQQQMIELWNPAPAESADGPCIQQLFERHAARSPEAVAVICEQSRLTYRELNARANQLAHYLQNLGVGPEVPVALCLERSLELVVSVLAVLKAGGAYVPIDPACPAERMAFMLKDTGAQVMVTQRSQRDSMPACSAKVLWVEDFSGYIGAQSAENLPSQVQPSNAAYVIYTSGSTGQPKGVQVTHQNVVRLFTQTEQWFHFTSEDVWTLFHSYTFDFSVWELWGALLYGGRLVVVPYIVSRSPGEFYELLCREKVTVLNQTPSAFRQLIWAEQSSRVPRELTLRYVICGGEALELQSLKPWFERHGDERPCVVNMYGITETTVHVTYRVIRQTDLTRCLGSVLGVPIPDLRLYVLDQHLKPVPPGVPGELCVGGAGVARGYLNRPELTAERFIADPFSAVPGARLYRSGDLARWTSQNELEYLGRMDQQVKIRGFRVELGEIQAALGRHPSVRETVVVVQDVAGDQRLVAYFVPVGEGAPSDDLRAYLAKELPDYMVPALFCRLTSMPLTRNGKIDRRALPEPDWEHSISGREGVPPRNPTEELLAGIWSELLGRKVQDVHANFFQLGGHSLLASQVTSRAAAALNIELSVRLLFEHPTIAGLAEVIAKAREQQPQPNAPIPRRLEGAEARELLARLEQMTPSELEEFLQTPAGQNLNEN